MRALLVERTGDRATVRLTPSWLARLFGAREVIAELHVARVANGYRGLQAGELGPERWDGGALRWRFVATGRDVRDSEHSQLIITALELVPVASPTRAIARLDAESRL